MAIGSTDLTSSELRGMDDDKLVDGFMLKLPVVAATTGSPAIAFSQLLGPRDGTRQPMVRSVEMQIPVQLAAA